MYSNPCLLILNPLLLTQNSECQIVKELSPRATGSREDFQYEYTGSCHPMGEIYYCRRI